MTVNEYISDSLETAERIKAEMAQLQCEKRKHMLAKAREESIIVAERSKRNQG
jgi:F0F1-type ATP synthase membrane subunit b/b'